MNKSGDIIFIFSGQHNVAAERQGYYAFKVHSQPKKPLFERIGGAGAVDAAVELFYNKVLADTRINSFFKKTDMTKQRQMQKQFLTFAFGGSTKWNGKSMRAAHKHMNLEDSHFGAVAENLAKTLKELGVP